MNILVLTADIPVSSSLPGSPRAFEFCRQLSKTHNLFLFFYSLTIEREQFIKSEPEFKEVFKEITVLNPEPKPSLIGKYFHRLALASHLSLKCRNRTYFRQVQKLCEDLCRQHAIDVIYVEGLKMTQFVPAAFVKRTVVDLVDCLTVLYRQLLSDESSFSEKLKLRIETFRIASWEKNVPRHFPKVVLISEKDSSNVKKLSGCDNISTIPNGIDRAYFTTTRNTSAPASENSKRFVFTGVMTYGPNADAVQYFAKEIFPLLKAEHPDAEFYAVGANPSPSLLELNSIPGVHVTGFVPDIRPYISSAAVYVSPIRFGTGMKNKLLSAFSIGVPVVATSASIEGLNVFAGQHLLAADQPRDFADAVNTLLENRKLAQQLATAAQNAINTSYSWADSAKQLEKLLLELPNN